MSPKVKGLDVIWNKIYDLLLTIIVPIWSSLWDIAHLKLSDLTLSFQGDGKSKVLMSNERFMRLSINESWQSCPYLVEVLRNSLSKTKWPYFVLLRSSKVEGHDTKWRVTYDSLWMIIDCYVPIWSGLWDMAYQTSSDYSDCPFKVIKCQRSWCQTKGLTWHP